MQRLILLGGGHAHVKVLAELAKRPLPGWEVRLITPYRRQIYSGMLPGWVAGHYGIDDCAIALDALAARAGVELDVTAGTGLEADARELRCANGARLRFDRLSIDTGSGPALGALPGGREHGLPIRPIEGFVAAWPGLVDRILGRCARFDLTIVGAGAAGVELAFAIRQRALRDGWSHLQLNLLGGDLLPLEGFPQAARRRAQALLLERGIRWLGGDRVAAVAADHLRLQSGALVPADAALLVTGAGAPSWLAQSGLRTDERGFVSVGPTLQSISHPMISAAGDVAAYAEKRPKSGVYAVRAGPVLADNLRALCEGSDPRIWTPQRCALYLIGTGDRHAIGSWGPWAFSGAWAWRWKDRIDRRFIRRFAAAGQA